MSHYTELHLDRAALLTVDVQNDFTLADAPAEIAGTLQAVPAIQIVLRAFRRAARPIVHVVRLYQPDGSNVELTRRKQIEDGDTLVLPGSDGADLLSELKPDRTANLDPDLLLAGEVQQLANFEWAMYKPRWGAFFNTSLHHHLKNLDVDTVVVCGCNFPNCPRTTLYEASERDYRLGLVTDGTSGLYDQALIELADIGVKLHKAASYAEKLEQIA